MNAALKKKHLWKVIVLWFYGVLLLFILCVFLEIILILPSVIEKAHKAEARSYLTQMRARCEYFYDEDGNTRRCTVEDLGIDVPGTGMSGTCTPSHAFCYSVEDLGNSKVACTAVRCTQGGAAPRNRPYRVTLIADFRCEAGNGDACDEWESD